ncbi:unnamed protein product [Closterium sp. NIES-65]|nr:unnamed protein product [Closterium sp. NIES-65]
MTISVRVPTRSTALNHTLPWTSQEESISSLRHTSDSMAEPRAAAAASAAAGVAVQPVSGEWVGGGQERRGRQSTAAEEEV